MVSSYAMFVKEHIHQFSDLPAKQRMKAVAELYHKQKSGMSEAPAKKGRGRPKKGGALTAAGLGESKLVRKNKGGSLLGDIIPFGNMLGLGLEDKEGGQMTAAGLHKKRGRPSKGGSFTAGALVNSPTMSGQTGGSFGDMFFKGLTLPFAAASKINPVFGFGVPQAAKALGLKTLI